MAVASKSGVSSRKRQVNASKSITESQKIHSVSKRPQVTNTQNLSVLPRRKPLWLIRLLVWHRGIGAMTFSLVVVMLTMYTWTMYCQKTWNQSYRKLENLQRYERKLTTTNEVLKNKMAQQAEQGETNLVPSIPQTAIFLKPAPQRSEHPVQTVVPPHQVTTHHKQPLGY